MENGQILKVPENTLLRNELMETARGLVRERDVMPPGNYELIGNLAEEVLSRTGCNNCYREFAMVLCGNEIWRKVVESTPFNRRLLLLPQCLKSKENCKGIIDQLGLICAGCGKCGIDRILETAEALGYTSLVAEGTTVVLELVQEGSVDAIIGVSCMSVLEKSFGLVSGSGVPVIGIPLLFEGCVNTVVDYEWLMVELTTYHENPFFQPFSVSEMKNTLQHFFVPDVLKKYLLAEENKTAHLAIQSILNGGRRIRPLLTALAYKAYSTDYSEELLFRLALIVECFHKASLIHDDVEDNDDYRYGTETLHKIHGTGVAINTGDFLLGKGYQLLSCLPLPSERLSACFKIVSEGHVDLSLGQGDDLLAVRDFDILSTDDLLRLFERKTGAAIKVSLLLGANAAGTFSDELSILKAFSGFFGIAYQIRDDLQEYREKGEDTDLTDYPLLLSLLAGYQDSHISKEFMQELFRNHEKEKVDELIRDYSIELQAKQILQEYIEKAYEKLDQLQNLKMKLSLYTLLNKIF